MKRKWNGISLSLLVALVMVLSACDAVEKAADKIRVTPIGKVLDHPRQYNGKELWIKGKVVETFSLIVIKYFILRDETGEITVVATDNILPRKGETVRIKGKIEEAFSIGDEQLLVFVEAEAGS